MGRLKPLSNHLSIQFESQKPTPYGHIQLYAKKMIDSILTWHHQWIYEEKTVSLIINPHFFREEIHQSCPIYNPQNLRKSPKFINMSKYFISQEIRISFNPLIKKMFENDVAEKYSIYWRSDEMSFNFNLNVFIFNFFWWLFSHLFTQINWINKIKQILTEKMSFKGFLLVRWWMNF